MSSELRNPFEIEGFRLVPEALDRPAQVALAREIMAAAEEAPFGRYTTPGGAPMSVAMTSLGPFGWTSNPQGYRYRPDHPVTGRPWPAMPDALLTLWRAATGLEVPPDSCLVNLYRGAARMGLHQDRDEADLGFPVVSISLGDDARFRLGGLSRREPTAAVTLRSGDLVVLGGRARLAFHGIDRILGGSSSVVPGGGRLNLTLRRARPA
jgi:alkylated DNA repair protein (DNA oxidative demethylase)